jgi:hypothetical protein
VSARCRPGDGAVGMLLVAPAVRTAPERFEQMMVAYRA